MNTNLTPSAVWKRTKSEALPERYCSHGTHYVQAELATKRRHGKRGGFICDTCDAKRSKK